MKPLLSLFLLLSSNVALSEPAAEPGVSSGTYIQLLLGLGLILGLLWATAFFARKLLGGKGFGQGGLRLLGGVALGPKERIVLVEAGDTWLVVGIVPGQIRTLHTLPKGSLPDAPPSTANEIPFAQWLQRIKERGSHAK